MQPKLQNATPLDLTLKLLHEGIEEPLKFDLKSFGKVTFDLPDNLVESDNLTVEIWDKRSKSQIGRQLEFHPASPLLIIGPNYLRSGDSLSTETGPVRVSFVNQSEAYAVLYRKDEQGEEKLVSTTPLAPSDEYGEDSRVGQLYIARSAFTNEVLAVFLIDDTINGPLVINDKFKNEKKNYFPLSSPVSKILPSAIDEIPSVKIITPNRAMPNTRSKDYVFISDRKNFARKKINTVENRRTRTVRISGVELIWDSKGTSDLNNYQGETVTDIESLEIFADRVVISTPLRFPGTEVKIFARELEFKGNGKIDTTPLDYGDRRAISPNIIDGTPANYQAANGLEGEPGGNIHLNVRKLILPDGKKRLITKGAKGQQAEVGGLKAYEPGKTGQPAKGKSKNLTKVVNFKALMNALAEAKIEGIYKEEKHWKRRSFAVKWRLPTGAKTPLDIRVNNVQLFPEEGGSVTSLQLALCIDEWHKRLRAVLWLPSGKLVWKEASAKTERTEFKDLEVKLDTPTRPGNGEDAYPGGKPGDGGQGGTIYTNLGADQILPICDKSGGAPGKETAMVKGGEKGKPFDAIAVKMVWVSYDFGIASSREPRIEAKYVTAEDGKDAPGKTGEQGQGGEIKNPEGNNYGWMHPVVIDAVLACAKDACRNEHREFAARLLDPYYAELKYALSEPGGISSGQQSKALTTVENLLSDELSSRLTVIEGLRIRLLNNLDFYGNPPGWLPRLNLNTNFDIFQSVRKISSKLLYYSLSMEEKYESLENRSELARQTKLVLSEEMEITQQLLKDAFSDLALAILDLESVARFLNENKDDINQLRDKALSKAQTKVEEQRIFRGVMKLLGGLMGAIPIGQPYLGLVGDVTSQVGDVNWNNPDGIHGQITETLDGIVNTTSAFLEENRDLIIKNSVKNTKFDYSTLDKVDNELAESLATAEGNLAEQEGKVEKAKARWKKENEEAIRKEIRENKKNLKETMIILKEDKEFRLLKEEKQKEKLAEIAILQEWSEQSDIQDLVEYQEGLEETIDTLQNSTAYAEENATVKEAIEKFGGFKETISGLNKKVQEAKKARKVASEETAAAIKAKGEKTGKAVDRLHGIVQGVPKIAGAINTLMSPTKIDDPEVIELAQKILESEYKEEYQKLVSEIYKFSQKQQKALEKISISQHAINAHSAVITDLLIQLNGLSHTQQSLDASLDLRVKRYLKDMKERALDGLQWAIYNFVMAFRYEELNDVRPDLYNLGSMVKAIRNLQGLDTETWEFEDFEEVEKQVMASEFMELYKDCIKRRQHESRSGINFFKGNKLCKKDLELLRRNGKVTINLVRDYTLTVGYKTKQALIMEITDVKMKLDIRDDERTKISVQFKHSGESIIYDGKNYLWFDSGSDDPISWQFNYNNDTEPCIPDQAVQETDKFNKFLKAAGGEEEIGKYLEYYPSFFGDITIILNPTTTWKESNLNELTEVEFTVKYMHGGG